MGNRISVTDAGPIIHLSEIGQIKCFSLFQPVYVPEVIYEELRTRFGPGSKEEKRNFLRSKKFLKVILI